MSINDKLKAYLESLGYTSSVPTAFNAELANQVGRSGSTSDLLNEFLSTKTSLDKPTNDMLKVYLESLGYTGTVNDMLLASYTAGDFFETVPPPVTTYGLLFGGVDGAGDSGTNFIYNDFDITLTIAKGTTGTNTFVHGPTTANRISASDTNLVLAIANSVQSIPFSFSIGVDYKVRIVRTGAVLDTFINDTPVDTRAITTSSFVLRYLARTSAATPVYYNCAIKTLSIGTPADPLEHVYENTTGAGTSWADVGTVGGVNIALSGGYTWVENT